MNAPEEIEVGAHGLILRRWRMADGPALLEAVERSLPELRRWMPWAMETPTLTSVEEFLRTAVSGDVVAFGLLEPDGGLVGAFGLHDRRGPGILEIGYWVRSDRTGRGYATAAARALTDAGFDCFPDVDRMEIRCDPANLASAAIPPKLGYRLEHMVAVPVEAAAQTGGLLVWAMTRATWRTNAGRPAPPVARTPR